MTNDQLLVTLDGPGIGESGVPLETFTAVLGRIQSAMRVMVGHLGGREPSPGQPPSWMRDQSRMRLTATRSGSFVAQLTLEPSRDGQSDLFGYGPRALEAILGWDGMEDSTLPPIVVDELQQAASSLPPDVQLWLGDGDDSRKVEVGRTTRVDKLPSHYQNHMVGRRAIISFQTLEELWFGAYKGGWGEQRKNGLRRDIDQYEVVWSSPDLARIPAHLRSERERAGRRLNAADAWVAATALLPDCPLVSHDRDFAGIPNLEFISSTMATNPHSTRNRDR